MENTGINDNIGVKYGLITGLIVVIITLLQYLGGIDMFMSPVGYISYLVIITVAVLAALKVRKGNEGFLEFRQALKITFTVFALSLLLQTIFIYILFNFVDPSFKDVVSVETMNKAEQWMRKAGRSDAEIDKWLDMERGKDPYAIGRVIMGYATFCIVSFIFCLLISLIVRKSKPAFKNI
ncbi:MAG: DUF4199 domain-containing protein [Chitinophagaceae bacterium]|nr:DUF4199 domain-containing protein [Chitinophagaceae bacterium]